MINGLLEFLKMHTKKDKESVKETYKESNEQSNK